MKAPGPARLTMVELRKMTDTRAGFWLQMLVAGLTIVGIVAVALAGEPEDRTLETLKTEFVSTVSHELRTPLAAIYGAAMTLGRWFGPALIDRFGRTTTVRGLGVVALVGLALVVFGGNLATAMAGAALWGLANASSLGLMSRRVGADEQGQLQGANSSIQGIANLFGPGLFTLTFAYAIRPELGVHVPGAPFILAALLLAAAMGIAWRVTRDRRAD